MANQNAKDIVEVIYSKDGKTTCKIFKNTKHELAEVVQLFNELGPATFLHLDLHGVADLFDVKEELSKLPVSIVSFVGAKGETRVKARDDIVKRIENKYAVFGCLVFNRTTKPDQVGTKAWVLKNLVNPVNRYFLDDSSDHVLSVNNSKINKMTVYEIKKADDNVQKKQVSDIIRQIEALQKN